MFLWVVRLPLYYDYFHKIAINANMPFNFITTP